MLLFMRKTKLLGSLVLATISCAAVGQKVASCPIDVPLNVIVRDGRLIRDLRADQFTGETKHDSVRVLAAIDDAGPRRILLILETGRSVPTKIRALESSVVADMLSEARSGDSFALLTTRGFRKALPFDTSPDVIAAAVKELETKAASDGDGSGVLDALLEGAGRFDRSKPGDAIFLMTLGLESEHKASYSSVRKQLANRQVRLFSLQFTPFLAGSVTGGIMRFTPRGVDVIAHPSFVPNDESAGNLSSDSGGYTISETILGDAQHDYAVTSEKLEEIKTAVSRMHSAIMEYYRVTLDTVPSKLSLTLVPDLQNKVPSAMTIYPKQLPTCSASAKR
jgi:hypothetical protein